MELSAEQALMTEIADLKLQMKQKKKELKSRMKADKGKLKKRTKEGDKMKKQKGVQEGKTKMRCQSESSSSSSESSDEECVSVSMKKLRQGQSMLEDARGNTAGGVGEAATACASDAIEVCNGLTSNNLLCNGFASNVLSLANNATDICREESFRVPLLGRDTTETYSSMPSMGCFNDCLSMHKVMSGLDEVQKHANTSDSRLGFTLNSFPPKMSNRVEVCAGGKCKKAGSEQLLSALYGQIPESSNVVAVPCKCMGKCSMGINVRVHKEDTNPQHHSLVGVEDASLVLSHHFGLGRPSTGLPSLAPKDGVRVTPLPLMIA